MRRIAALAIIVALAVALAPERAMADRRTEAAVVGGLTLAGAALASALEERRTTMEARRGIATFPDLGVETSVRPGEAIYANFNYDEVDVVMLTDAVVSIDMETTWPAGTIFYEMLNGKYCLPDGSKCFEDPKQRGFFKRAGRDTVRRELIDVHYSTDIARLSASDEGFRAELIYQGRGGGVLRLGYREFVDDMARPSFSQLITYDLVADGPTTIAFQDLTFEIRSADNRSIRYVVQGQP